MYRKNKRLASCLSIIALTTLSVTCTLNITTPDNPPPDTWDPMLNTHPDSLVFQKLLDTYVYKGLPGVVLYVRTPLGIWNGASGYANIESSERMLPTHRHYAASVTKMYIATAVMLLVEDGLIDLDTRISSYLPASIYKRIDNGSQATVRHLLGHTSGIPDFGVLEYDLDTFNDPLDSYSTDRMLSYVEKQSSFFKPGKDYFYSNTNYLLLALLIDHVTGVSHANIITQRIIRHLGLTATYYKNESGYPLPPGLVKSYQDIAGNGRLMNVSDLTVYYTGIFFGYAGLIATSADYAEFIDALFSGHLVGPETLAEMQEHTECDCYGLGLGFADTPWGTGIGHSGGDFGVLSEVRIFPDADATIVLLANAGNSGVIEELFDRLKHAVQEQLLANNDGND